jgi:tetratricopeptide (TPR) repeat protein
MRHILTVTLLLSTYFLVAQDGHTRQASLLFEDYEYVDAIDNYSKLVDKGHSNAETYKKLGDANYYNAKYTEAAEWYGKLVKIDSNDIEPEYYYLYAQALKSQERYKESDKWMQKFMEKSKNDSRALRFNEVRDYLNRIEKNSDRYIIQKNLISHHHFMEKT